MTLHICPGRQCITATVPDDRKARWCFHCRKHLPHTWAMLEDPPERQPSYYEPVPVLRCSGCKRDCTDFPGIYLDGARYPSEAVWKRLCDLSAAEVQTWDWDAIWERHRAELSEWDD